MTLYCSTATRVLWFLQAGARGEELADYVKQQGHEAAQLVHDNTDKAADMLTDAAKKARTPNLFGGMIGVHDFSRVRCSCRTQSSDAVELLIDAFFHGSGCKSVSVYTQVIAWLIATPS